MGRNARNMARKPSTVSGPELLDGRLQAIGDLRALRLLRVRTYPVSIIRHSVGTLSHRRIQDIVDMGVLLQVKTGAEQPAIGQFWEVRRTTNQTA